jgi:hypothetical protein
MSSISLENQAPRLVVTVNGNALCAIAAADIPCERSPSIYLEAGSVLAFVDGDGIGHQHALGDAAGWFHFSIRVHPNLGCQADCVVTHERVVDPQAFSSGKATGIRFQPFFLTGAHVAPGELRGRGLFRRGLHFSGNVTPANIILSCECDRCRESFQIHSFHAGFANVGYFYSGSGKYTIMVSDHIPGSPAALAEPDAVSLAALEAQLPSAPDGTSYRYTNPFRCPHCGDPYIDFETWPQDRPGEYYGNYFVGSAPIRFTPST